MGTDSSMATSSDSNPMVVLRNCESESLYILAILSIRLWKNLVFQTVGKSYRNLLFNMFERGMWLKTRALFSHVFAVSKIFEKLVNNSHVEYLKKSDLLSNFQFGFRSFHLTVDLLTVASDRTSWVFCRFKTTETMALDMSKAFEMVMQTGLFHKRKFHEI